MFKKRLRNKNSLLLQTSNRISDTLKPDSINSIVNESETVIDELPKEITAVLCEANSEKIVSEENTSVINSVSLSRVESTPAKLFCVATKDKSSQNYLKCLSTTPPSSSHEKEVDRIVEKEIFYMDEVLKQCGAYPLSGDSSYLMCKYRHHVKICIINILNYF